MAITVTVEMHILVLAGSALVGLDPLAPPGTGPQRLDEANRATLGVGAVVLAHDRLDGLGGFVGMVEGNGGNVVVQDMGLDDAVHEVTADEAELTVNGCCSAAGKGPCLARVVREGRVGVLKVGDGHCHIC